MVDVPPENEILLHVIDRHDPNGYNRFSVYYQETELRMFLWGLDLTDYLFVVQSPNRPVFEYLPVSGNVDTIIYELQEYNRKQYRKEVLEPDTDFGFDTLLYDKKPIIGAGWTSEIETRVFPENQCYHSISQCDFVGLNLEGNDSWFNLIRIPASPGFHVNMKNVSVLSNDIPYVNVYNKSNSRILWSLLKVIRWALKEIFTGKTRKAVKDD